MKRCLPDADQAYVEPAKVRDYLLVCRQTNDKSEFFQRFGFRHNHWQVLQEELLRHAGTHIEQTPMGVNYAV